MNKKEFIERLIDMRGCGAKWTSWERGWDDAISDVIRIAEELDEWKQTDIVVGILKPVIPQFVADWIDAHDLHGNNPLREYRDLESDFNEGWTDEEDAAVYHWVNENPYAFIDALRYGYEVEKEKLYYVLDKEDATLLKKTAREGVAKLVGTKIYNVKSWKDEEKYQLTEQEIKDYDERYWVFAQEVTQ